MSPFVSACGTLFVAVGFLCAPFAAGVTFFSYVLIYELAGKQKLPALSIAIGLLAGGLAIGGLWRVYRTWYQGAGDVYPDQHKHLLRRLESAGHRLAATQVPAPTALQAAARADAVSIDNSLRAQLERVDARWLSAAAYLEAWSDLNRLEEALLYLLPRPQVLALAEDDLSRLQGGAGSKSLQSLEKRLKDGIGILTKAGSAAGAGGPPEPAEELARADVALVRNAINRTREDQWGQLVGSRNNMMLAAAIAGIIAYLSLVSVVLWGMDPKALQVAATFVMTGTLISLLHQVTLVDTRAGGVSDFGQSTARLLSATFVSGLIALLGVVVIEGTGLHVTIDGGQLFETHGGWAQTFDWTQDRVGYFWAAAFGLTPSLLFKMLQNRTDQIKTSLNASRATGGS
ncbi:MAG TPA: hypothetical protein VOB72_16255 [Candidatus Dormibacteraeota bacterium]|nr:hypothetical protein [Candidatus Dormibacteraeota bacterium]